MNLLFRKILNKIKKHTIGLQLANFKNHKHFFINKKGIEIGGPSSIFKTGQILPVYSDAEQIDGVNFSNQTVWENTIHSGLNYRYEVNKIGYQHILEASDLSYIENEKYDFLLSSHCLEHCANPIKAVKEWKRVIKKGGIVLLVLPDKRVTFDHKRPVTELTHLIQDYELQMPEDDQTHFEEALKLHDISMDRGIENYEKLVERTYDNYNNRCVHHHIFDMKLLKEIMSYTEMEVLYTDVSVLNLIVIARKL